MRGVLETILVSQHMVEEGRVAMWASWLIRLREFIVTARIASRTMMQRPLSAPGMMLQKSREEMKALT